MPNALMARHPMDPAIQQLPPVVIEGHESARRNSADHPMRVATRRAAGFEADGWTPELRGEVADFFDALADEWHTRTTPQRRAVVMDALTRGVDPLDLRNGVAIEIGSGIGTYSSLLAEWFRMVVAIDLSPSMLARAPAAPAHRVQADASMLPVHDAAAAVVVLINAFLFPAEVARVLSRGGALVWVNSSGAQTPIHLSAEEVVAALPGSWTGVASQAGAGTWCVLRRR
jgi:SAM-dependent methyltransferase